MCVDIGYYKGFSSEPKRSQLKTGETLEHLRQGFQMKIGREEPQTGQTSTQMTAHC